MFRIFHYKPMAVFKVLIFQLRYHKVLIYCVKPIVIKVCKCVCKRERERERIVTIDCLFYSITFFFITNQNIFLGNAYFYYLNLTILHDFSNTVVFKIQFRKYE